MTDEEFSRWLQHHQAAYPSLSDWLARVTRQTDGEATTTPEAIMACWANILADVPYDAAIAATDAMARGDEEEPRGYDRHPAAIRAMARRIAARRATMHTRPIRIDGQETYACPRCLDSGVVTIYHPRTIAAARRGMLTPGTVYTAAAACSCQAGRRWDGYIGRYDRAEHLVVPAPEPTGADSVRTIEAWAAER